jgi:hydrogenase maturation factor
MNAMEAITLIQKLSVRAGDVILVHYTQPHIAQQVLNIIRRCEQFSSIPDVLMITVPAGTEISLLDAHTARAVYEALKKRFEGGGA